MRDRDTLIILRDISTETYLQGDVSIGVYNVKVIVHNIFNVIFNHIFMTEVTRSDR